MNHSWFISKTFSAGILAFGLAARYLPLFETVDERVQAPPRTLGFWAGKVWIADDFNDTPPEWLESVEADL